MTPMRSETQVSAVFIAIFLVATVAACSRTTPSRFYLLSDLPGAEAKAPVALPEPCFTLGIGPVEMPDYLDRPQIVTQVTPNELQLGEFDQWAEPLAKTFMRTLADNLAALLCVEEVVFYPSDSAAVDYQIVVTVTRFHGLAEGSVALTAQWQVMKGGTHKAVARKRTVIRESIEGQGYAALVAAQSKALAQLSREIAEAVSRVSGE
jgi:uncharacterized protein